MTTTMHRNYSEIDEFDSSVSILLALIVLSLIIGLGYLYGLPKIQNNAAEASFESALNSEVIEPVGSISRYPEPGSLAY